MPAVVVVVMIIISVLVYPQHALYTPNYATGHPANSTAHDPADRSGRHVLTWPLADAVHVRLAVGAAMFNWP
jgi:hypothetical protein